MRRPQQRRLHLIPLHAAVRLPEPTPAAAERRHHGTGSCPRGAGQGGRADGGPGRRNGRDRRRSERRDSGTGGHQQPSNDGHDVAR